MGYSSHVLFAVDATEDTTLRLTHPSVAEVLDCACNLYTGTWSDTKPNQVGYYVYEWGSIKWYESWPAVAALESYMDGYDSDNYDDYPFMFLRDGEDMTDMEHKGSWDFDLECGIRAGGSLKLIPTETSPQLELPMEFL